MLTPTDSIHRNRSPKIVTGDYVGDPYICATFGANPSAGCYFIY